MIWEILSLSELQEMLNLRKQWTENCVLDKKVETVAGQTFAKISERSKGWRIGHIEAL